MLEVAGLIFMKLDLVNNMLHPVMQFRRQDYEILNGEWEFDFDDNDSGIKELWFDKKLGMIINVPYPYQSKLSGINNQDIHDILWYRKAVHLKNTDGCILLHFEAVDYRCDIYINGTHIAHHEGGHIGFVCDISDYRGMDIIITLRVYDPSFDKSITRGKQTWDLKPHDIWYTRTSGIWQSVWVEYKDKISLNEVRYYPDDLTYSNLVEMEFSSEAVGKKLKIVIACIDYHKEIVLDIQSQRMTYKFVVDNKDDKYLWTVDNPALFDVRYVIYDDNSVYDTVDSYFGIRTICAKDGKVLLNHKPFYQKLVLNQGYTKDGLLSFEKDEDYLSDILKMKNMGFNGCRLHQKSESSQFLYYADKYGFVVWQECAAFYEFNDISKKRLKKEWYEIVKRDFNHPSIIAWTPFNESWGLDGVYKDVQKQDYAHEIYQYIKSLDNTRFVNANDGWEIVKADIVGFHNYEHGQKDEKGKYQKYCHDLKTLDNILNMKPGQHELFASSTAYNGEPIMITEFGGIAYNKDSNAWGYTTVNCEEEFIYDYRRMIEAIYTSDVICGFCYTQLTDVEQEQNGLLDALHNYKVDPLKIREINDMNNESSGDKSYE